MRTVASCSLWGIARRVGAQPIVVVTAASVGLGTPAAQPLNASTGRRAKPWTGPR
jgi:hypothetical protein